MLRDGIQLHNVGELVGLDSGRHLIQRVPESVRAGLNEQAQSRMRHPAGVELRFVPEGPVELTLSMRSGGSADSGTVQVFWGPIQGYDEFEIDASGPTTLEIERPEKLDRLAEDAAEPLAFDPAVCRVRLPGEHRGGYTCYHGVDGAFRAPHAGELPEVRYLAYGTSITEGEAPMGEHLNYVSQTARRLNADLINLGACGSAYCDAAIAEHIAARDDWDVATFSISVNMLGTFSVSEFRERAANLLDTVARENPGKPVVPITIFRNGRDVLEDEGEECARFREALREVVAASDHDNVHLLEGPELLPSVAGLTTDLVHPGDNAMVTMGENLAAELETLR